MAVVLNSFICKRPFFANEKFTFANLSRTPRLCFAGVSCENILLDLLPKKKVTFANSGEKKKTFAGCHGGTLAALAIKNPYMNDSHASISMFRA